MSEYGEPKLPKPEHYEYAAAIFKDLGFDIGEAATNPVFGAFAEKFIKIAVARDAREQRIDESKDV